MLWSPIMACHNRRPEGQLLTFKIAGKQGSEENCQQREYQA